MAWEGFFTYAGTEIINVARVEQYAEAAGFGWFTPLYNNPSLPYLLGDGMRYSNPLQDDAPWTDPDIPESYEFHGIYPLEVAGIEDSTRASDVVESTKDGGIPGRLRHATKEVVFNVVLLAENDAAANYGFQWLKQALLGSPCGDSANSPCNGADLCYLSAMPAMDLTSPDLDDPETCLTPYLRTLRKVLINSGPQVTAKREPDGNVIWTAQFTAVAGSPFEFGADIPVIEGFGDPEVTTPYVGGVTPDGGYFDLEGDVTDEVDCAPKVYEAVFDPLNPAIIPPPTAPNVPLGVYSPPENWYRRLFTIPKQWVPLWGEVNPRIEVHAPDEEIRNLRVRFYADPFDIGSTLDDPCAYCGDIVISYVPPNHTLIFDGASETIHVLSPGGILRRADSLVFKTDGTPFDWPRLSCGFGYIVTLDLPQKEIVPVVDLALIPRVM